MRHSEQSSDWRLCIFLFLQVFNITFKRRICLPDFADIAFSNLRWIAQDLVTFAGFSARLQLETSRPSPAQLSVCLSVCLTLSIPSVLTSLANPVQFRHSITSYCRDLNGDQGSGAQQLRPVEMSCPGTSEALGSVPLGDGDVATMEGTDWPLVIQKPALG